MKRSALALALLLPAAAALSVAHVALDLRVLEGERELVVKYGGTRVRRPVAVVEGKRAQHVVFGPLPSSRRQARSLVRVRIVRGTRRGRRAVKVVPRSSAETASSVPECASTICEAM